MLCSLKASTMRHAAIAAISSTLVFMPGVGSAQISKQDMAAFAREPIEQIPIQMNLDSGLVAAKASRGRRPELVYETTISLDQAPWIRLQFQQAQLSGDPHLGDDAFLWITSLADGAAQVMTARDLENWGYTSAYFNGDTVRVELYAYPGAGQCRLRIDTVLIGPPADLNPLSLCGVDDRVLSNDPRAARVLPAGCTVFMIDDQTHNFLTAGHCSGSLSVVQFNVPMSTEGGGLVNPPPQDQYPVDSSSLQWEFTGAIGNDWAYFGTFTNSNTGLTPFQAQGDFYQLANAAPPVVNQTIRITGYGTDTTPPSSNQVQQSSDGPYVQTVGTIIRYAVDTTGGNSGSPVVDLTTGLCIGVHTNAGCSSTGAGSNQGTAIQNPNLQNALSNPMGVTAAVDCNDNGVPDNVEIQQGAQDCNNNGVLDECEVLGIPGDLNSDNIVNGVDLALLLTAWGQGFVPADINNDGVVDGVDLAILLTNWGTLCD